MRHVNLLVVALCVGVVSGVISAAGNAPASSKTLEQIGSRRGVCLWFGGGPARCAIKLAQASELVVYVQAGAPRRRWPPCGGPPMRPARWVLGFMSPGEPNGRLQLATNLADAVVAYDASAELLRGEACAYCALAVWRCWARTGS